MAMAPDVAEALERKSALKPMLKKQCRGRWELVVLLPDGSFTVYNTLEQASKARTRYGGMEPQASPLETKPKRAPRKPATAVTVPAEPAPRPTPPAAPEPERAPVVIDLAKLERATTIQPGVNIVKYPKPEFVDERVWVPGDETAANNFDWSKVDLELKAFELRDRMADGYPAAMGFYYHPDVLAVYGMDTKIVEDAMRHPDRVEVKPESFGKTKGWPVIGFYRGDVTVVVGFRIPTRPMIIAAYVTSTLQHDTHRTEGAGAGGGGMKKRPGVPTTTSALAKRLQELGAELREDHKGTKATVIYRGQELGCVSMGDLVKKDVIESDYQRMQRKIHARFQSMIATG